MPDYFTLYRVRYFTHKWYLDLLFCRVRNSSHSNVGEWPGLRFQVILTLPICHISTILGIYALERGMLHSPKESGFMARDITLPQTVAFHTPMVRDITLPRTIGFHASMGRDILLPRTIGFHASMARDILLVTTYNIGR